MLNPILTMSLAQSALPTLAFTVTVGEHEKLYLVHRSHSQPLDLGIAQHPVWSPDGSTLAYIRRDPKGFGRDLMVCTPGTGNPRILHRQVANSCPIWASDSKTILFTVPRPQAKNEFTDAERACLVDSKTGKVTLLGDFKRGEAYEPRAVANNPWFLIPFVMKDQLFEHAVLWLVDTDGKRLRKLGRTELVEPSPNGRYVVHSGVEDHRVTELITGKSHRVRRGVGYVEWLPDSSAFTCFNSKSGSLMLVSQTGSILHLLPKGYDEIELSPTGKMAFLTNSETESMPLLFNLASGKIIKKFSNDAQYYRWEEKGKRVLYASLVGSKIVIKAFDTVPGLPAYEPKVLSEDEDLAPIASPDGKWLVFVTSGQTRLYECATGRWQDLAPTQATQIIFCPR